MTGEYHWSPKDQRYYTTQASRERPGEFEIIRTPSGPGRWNTDAVCVAFAVNAIIACEIAEALARRM